jgi:hypothetical protein
MSDYQDLLLGHREVMRAINIAVRAGLSPQRSLLWELSEKEPEQTAAFLEWFPDMIKHEEADKVRGRARAYGLASPIGEALTLAADEIANMIDPFYVERDAIGILSWYRKEDGRLVPATVMHDPDPTYYPDKQKEETGS